MDNQKTIADIFNTFTTKQKEAVYTIVGDEQGSDKITFDSFLERYKVLLNS